MKKNNIKILISTAAAVAVVIIVLAVVLAGKGDSEEAAETTAAAVEAEETTEKTTAEETTEEETETTDDGNYVMNPLTGQYTLPEDAEGNRPVAVTVNNIKASLPQYGTSEADIVFEIPVEGYLTRLICIYPDYESVPYIISVRSYRYYFLPLTLCFDAIYIHWGQDNSMMDYYYSFDMDSYNGMWNSYLFGRDKDRVSAGYATEHTSCFYGSLLAEQMESDGVRTTLADGYEGAVFNFNSEDELVVYSEESAETVDINFGGNTAKLVYDEETGTYLKYSAGIEQIDATTGEQLSYTNVFILEASMSWRTDKTNRLAIDLTDITNGAGYYITAGGAQKITWTKGDEYSQFEFYDTDGNELELNCGKTYIAITRSGTYSFE